MDAVRLSPLIHAQLNYLLAHSTPPVQVYKYWSGSSMHGLWDRVTLLIPYCLQYLRWDLIYNAQYPSGAPDVIFPQEDESFNAFRVKVSEEYHTRQQKDSLCDWNGKDPSSLHSLIHELRDMYTAYQRKRAGEVDDDRLAFEMSTMLSREGIEIYTRSNNAVPEEVRFSVPVPDMNINKMVTGCTWKHPQKIYAEVIFPVGRKNSPTLSPRIKLAACSDMKDLLYIDDIMLPTWVNGMCMAEYIPCLEENLEREIVRAASLIDERRQFIEALATIFGLPIQADPVFCRRATFHISHGTFTFLVFFELSTQFPRQRPVMILQSSTGVSSDGVPIRSQLTDCPWSPRWDQTEMAARVSEYVAGEGLNFKKYSMQATLT